jgi:GrpB-like predicted nucleotidyltransferase (UPF0157 family)
MTAPAAGPQDGHPREIAMRRPNFFIVGAPRSGTTSMYAYLRQHPEVFGSAHKEPQFFGSDLTPPPGAIRDPRLYLELFAAADGRPLAGEASVYYLLSTRAAAEIRDFAPAARIIAMLREPAAMAYSLHSLYRRSGNEDLPSFAEALDAEPERRERRRLPPGAYFPEGLLYSEMVRYSPMVERYLEVFGREQVHCILFDDFVRDTAGVYRRTLEFLGADPSFQAELDPRRAKQVLRLQAVRQLRRTPPEVQRRMQLAAMKQHEKTGGPPLAPELGARLRQLLAADVARLGELLGRDLGAWTRGEALPAEPAPGRGGATAPRSDGGDAAAERREPSPAPAAPARIGDVLASLRELRKIPAEVRARYRGDEPLERKVARWHRLRVPELELEQRPYDPAWADWFAAERASIAGALARSGVPVVAVEHFGSSAVPGLASKNMVDIAVGIDAPAGGAEVERALAGLGYESYGNGPIDPQTPWFWKILGDRAFVVHVCDHRRPWLAEQLDLRDYLRGSGEERDRYAELKRRLAARRGKSFLTYSVAKLALSIEMVDRARRWRAAAPAGGPPGAPSGRREARALDDQALVGAGADDDAGRRDLHLEAQQPALGDLHQADPHPQLLAGAHGADVAHVDARADRGLPGVEQRLDGLEAGVLDQADHARGGEDAVQVRRAHLRGDGMGRLAGQAGAARVERHGDE